MVRSRLRNASQEPSGSVPQLTDQSSSSRATIPLGKANTASQLPDIRTATPIRKTSTINRTIPDLPALRIQSVLDDATSNQNPTATLPTVLECTWLGRLMAISRPCLNCRNLTTNATRCTRCQTIWYQQHPKPDRPHYKGDYRKRAKQIRDNAIACWICGEGKRPNDPFTADHLIPADPNSPLAAAHRSCNSRRQNKPII